MEQLTSSETNQIVGQVKTWLACLSERAIKDIRNAALRELTKRKPSGTKGKLSFGDRLKEQKAQLREAQKQERWLK